MAVNPLKKNNYEMIRPF